VLRHPCHMPDAPPALASTATQVLWQGVTGGQLEELLYGLLDAMGASSLTWRAGSNTGVTASDGGRDLEATFDRPGPDGELDRQRWWVESKGRTGTVERSAVQSAVLEASARQDVDYLVVATNSRFSNPTRDWVQEWSRGRPRPTVKLWDRDQLDRLVRRHPTVAARILPALLDDGDRIRLLVDRFQSLGEEPAAADLEHFWQRRDWLAGVESDLLARAVGMFLCAEGLALPRDRPWWRLLGPADAPDAIVHALIGLPSLLGTPLPRPVDQVRAAAAAGRLLLAAYLQFNEEAAAQITLNPWRFVHGGEDVADDADAFAEWERSALDGVLRFARSELLDACSSDCRRVIADHPLEIDSLGAVSFWRLLLDGAGDNLTTTLVIEDEAEPCTVGCDLRNGCPLIASNPLTPAAAVEGIQRVLAFRRASPDGAAPTEVRGAGRARGTMRVTAFDNGTLSWRQMLVGDDQPDPIGRADGASAD